MTQKFLYLILVLSLAVTGCKRSDQPSSAQAGNETEPKKVAGALTLTELYTLAEKKIDKAVSVQGVVNHVCQHTGKRCFIVDSVSGNSIRIEARGNIGEFNNDLMGADILVRGILREKRLENAYIDDLEKKTLAEKDTAYDKSHCDAELENIAQMRNWMKEHNKPYYSVYFVEGKDYTIIE